MIVNFETSKGKFAFVDWTFGYSPVDFKYDVIGWTNELSEEDWEEIVDSRTIRITMEHEYFTQYFDYVGKRICKLTATESGKSLMESLNLPMGNWLLIKYDNR